jgi:hypothetical protein
VVELKSPNLSNGEAYDKRLSKILTGTKKIRVRNWNKHHLTNQPFLKMSLLDTYYKLTYPLLYGGSIQGRYKGTPHWELPSRQGSLPYNNVHDVIALKIGIYISLAYYAVRKSFRHFD